MEYIRLRKINMSELVLVATGYYSDHSIEGSFTAIKSFDVEEELKEYLKSTPADEYYNPRMFLNYLVVTKKVLEPTYSIQLNLGDFDKPEPEMQETGKE